MLFSVFMLALRSVQRNMLRSFLTILGIVIGVSAVITMVTLGNGATQAIQNQITSLGTNLLMVRPGQRGLRRWRRWRRGAVHRGRCRGDCCADRRRGARSRRRARTSATVVANGRNWATSVTGSTNAWFDTGNWKLSQRPHLRARRAARRRRGVRDRRDRAARDLRRHGRPDRPRPAAARQAVLVRRDRHPGRQGPERHGRPGRHGGRAAAHAATPRHRQPQGQHAAGVDGGRQRQRAAEGQPAPADARTPQARRRRRRQLQHLRHPAAGRDAVEHDAGADHACSARWRR